jgi:hypothetical protein
MHRKGGSAVIAVVLALAGMAATSSAAVYKVGGASGWTILGNVNYTDWAGKNTFHVGDIIGKFCISDYFKLLSGGTIRLCFSSVGRQINF